jgi:hypothetical protein
MLSQQLQQRRKSSGVVSDASLRDQLATIVDHRDVVVILCPVDPTECVQSEAPFSCSMTNRVGACAALMEGLDGPTPDQPFMTPANRRFSVFRSAVRWPRVVRRDRFLRLARPTKRDQVAPSHPVDTPISGTPNQRKTAAPV